MTRMTQAEFERQMNRMRSLFGEKSYPKERLNSIWNYCMVLPDDSFKLIVNRFVDSARTAPLPDEFKKLANEELKRLGLEDREAEARPSREALCWDCADSGNVSIVRKETHEEWAKHKTGTIRCHCAVGFKRPTSQGPQWNHAWAGSYKIDPVYFRNLKGDWKPKPNLTLVKMVRSYSNKSKSGSTELEPIKKILPTNEPEGAA